MNKYRFPSRSAAEDAVRTAESKLHLYQITLDILLRDEAAWTAKYEAENGSWFQMGIARCGSAHGGVVIVREFHPANNNPSQIVHWADSWLRDMPFYVPNADNETAMYYQCLRALRALRALYQQQLRDAS